MAPPFMQLPAYQVPQNALLDFGGLERGIATYKQGEEKQRRMEVAGRVGDKMRNALYGDAIGEALAGDRADLAGLAMQAKGQASSESRAASEDAYKRIDRMGRVAAAAADDPDPANRARAHAWLISQHPNKDKLDPVYLNPDTGLKMMAAEAGQYKTEMDRKMEAAKLGLVQAQAQQALTGKKPAAAQEWEYYQSLPEAQRPEYLRVKRAERWLDTGTNFVNPSIPNAAPIPKNPAAVAAQKELGKAQAQAQVELPAVVSRAEDALATIEKLRNHPGREYGTGGLGVLPGIPGTAQKDFVELNEQAKGQTFLQAFQLLKGGGAITNIEGEKATKAIARLDRAQSKQGYLSALNDLEQVVRSGMERAKYRAQGVPTAPVAPAAAAPRAIPPQAVDLLKSDPTPQKIRQFEEVFGPGSAAQHLGAR